MWTQQSWVYRFDFGKSRMSLLFQVLGEIAHSGSAVTVSQKLDILWSSQKGLGITSLCCQWNDGKSWHVKMFLMHEKPEAHFLRFGKTENLQRLKENWKSTRVNKWIKEIKARNRAFIAASYKLLHIKYFRDFPQTQAPNKRTLQGDAFFLFHNKLMLLSRAVFPSKHHW